MILQLDQYAAQREIKRIGFQRDIGDAIAKVYPHINWYINVSDSCSVVHIFITDISGRHGEEVVIKDIREVVIRKCVKVAGRILESFKISRDKNKDNFGHVINQINSMPFKERQRFIANGGHR